MIEMEVEQKNQESTCKLGDRKAKKPAHCPTGTDTNFKCPDKKKLVRMSRPQSFSLRPPSTFYCLACSGLTIYRTPNLEQLGWRLGWAQLRNPLLCLPL